MMRKLCNAHRSVGVNPRVYPVVGINHVVPTPFHAKGVDLFVAWGGTPQDRTSTTNPHAEGMQPYGSMQ